MRRKASCAASSRRRQLFRRAAEAELAAARPLRDNGFKVELAKRTIVAVLSQLAEADGRPRMSMTGILRTVLRHVPDALVPGTRPEDRRAATGSTAMSARRCRGSTAR